MPLLSIQQLAAVEALIAANLPQRLASLEGRLAIQVAPSALAELNAARTDDAERMRAHIKAVLDAHEGPKPMKSKAVVQALAQRGIECQLSLRAVRDHMSKIRARASKVVAKC